MKNPTLKILIGLAFSMILKLNLITTLDICNASRDQRQSLIIDCSRREKLMNIPQELNISVEVLDVSYNKISRVTKQQFAKYKYLTKLIMVNMKRVPGSSDVFDRDTFAGLSRLEYLDISGTFYSENYLWLVTEWPATLQVLKINNNKQLTSLNVTTALQLTEFYGNDCSFVFFPDFDSQAPLKIIELFNNPVNELLVMHIAPYCQLHRFGISFPEGRYLHSEILFCDCVRMKRWLLRFSIWSYPLNCTSKPGSVYYGNCESWFGEEEVSTRAQCTLRIIKIESFNLTAYIVIGGISVVVLILTLIAGIVYSIRRRRRLKEELGQGESSAEDEATEGLEEEQEHV